VTSENFLSESMSLVLYIPLYNIKYLFTMQSPVISQLSSKYKLPSNTNPFEFKLVTYNILADRWCFPLKLKNTRYQNIDESYLKWEYRSKKIKEQLLSFDSDIICLQVLTFI
jgi:mRNA deadenylase 3'-5' endonuclease subunit Ccr4